MIIMFLLFQKNIKHLNNDINQIMIKMKLQGIDLNKKNAFSWKRKLGFFFCTFILSCIIAIFWSMVHPVYTVVDFMTRGPIYFANAIVFLVIDFVIIWIKRDKKIL